MSSLLLEFSLGFIEASAPLLPLAAKLSYVVCPPQELNPSPFAAMILNHTGWVVYAVINIDWFIFVMEAIGLLCGIWLTLSLYPLANLKVRFLPKMRVG